MDIDFQSLPVEIRDAFIETAAEMYLQGVNDTLASFQACVDEIRENTPTMTDTIEQIRRQMK